MSLIDPDPRKALLAAEAQPIFGTTLMTGAIGGIVAGAAMILFQMAAHWALDNGAATPILEIDAVLQGVAALIGGGFEIVGGLVVHGVVSAAWGVVFCLLLPILATPWKALWSGVVYGIGVWGVMTYGVLPWANSVMSERVAMLPNWFFYSHIVYGACLMTIPLLRRGLSRAELKEQKLTHPTARIP